MKADALRGHLDALLLAVLDGEPRHGYAIIEALQERSGGSLALPTGTVYPALRRLERAGYVESAWSTVGGRERRTYRLTNAGRRVLAEERSAWQEFTSTIGAVLLPPPASSLGLLSWSQAGSLGLRRALEGQAGTDWGSRSAVRANDTHRTASSPA
jgi:PadR family transcriptional regulator PadR